MTRALCTYYTYYVDLYMCAHSHYMQYVFYCVVLFTSLSEKINVMALLFIKSSMCIFHSKCKIKLVYVHILQEHSCSIIAFLDRCNREAKSLDNKVILCKQRYFAIYGNKNVCIENCHIKPVWRENNSSVMFLIRHIIMVLLSNITD